VRSSRSTWSRRRWRSRPGWPGCAPCSTGGSTTRGGGSSPEAASSPGPPTSTPPVPARSATRSPPDDEWLRLVATTIGEARELGEIRADVDPRQLAYELDAYLDSANMRSLLGGDLAFYDLARAAVDSRLDSVTTG
jgi:hypothetical protein